MFLNVARAYAFLFFLSFIHCSPLVTSDRESPRVSHQATGLTLTCDVKTTELEELMGETTRMYPYRPVESLDPLYAFAQTRNVEQDYIAKIPDFNNGILIIVSTGKYDWFGSNTTDKQGAVNELLMGTFLPTTSRRSLRDDLKERAEGPIASQRDMISLEETLDLLSSYDVLGNASVLIVGAGTTSDKLNEIETQVGELIHSLNDNAQISSKKVLLENTASDQTDCAVRLSSETQSSKRIEIYLGVYENGERPYMQQDLVQTGEEGMYSLKKAQWEL